MTDNWKEITDPEELFRLKREGWEIEFANSSRQVFAKWSGIAWHADRQFRARPSQPKMKKVTLCKWYCANSGATETRFADIAMGIGWKRLPEEDKEIEVPGV